jgi:A/G-specific adenine glycosylase
VSRATLDPVVTPPAEPVPVTAATPAAELVVWQRRQGRHHLPWQASRDPYRVWLSEVMLQQTQVGTVLAYYDRFLERFPDVQALAAAPLDDVLARWSGLGYYSRARNLHRCAQVVVERHGGTFPATAAVLATLPGIGRSTAAAIAAFCFGERAAILDGNVKRVLTRLLGFGEDLAQPAAERRLWAQAESLLPKKAADMPPYTQGLMDLGATVCLARRPQCLLCPWQARCIARREGAPERYPVKTRKLKRGRRESSLLWLQQGSRLWLSQRPATGVWAGLWSLPDYASDAEVQALTAPWPGEGRPLPAIEHVLTHLDWRLSPWCHRLPDDTGEDTLLQVEQALPPGRWVARDEALALGLPAPVRKLLSG